MQGNLRRFCEAAMTAFMKRHLRLWLNAWPPFLGAGIRVTRIDRDWRAIDVEMKLRFFNRNYVGTHYGGSLYSMTDPFYMLMLIENLGREYIVWDKSASIRFRRPGRGNVKAEFRLSEQQLDHIRQQLETADKVEPAFTVEVRDDLGEIVAHVEKVVQVRKKSPNPTEAD
jgi:acyl-coenzyme A thioesterase PaaI-like protein